MLNQRDCSEVIVVDYGCPQGTYQYCRSLNLEKLIVIKVEHNADVFNVSRARNVGANLVNNDAMAFVDCDVEIGEDWLADCLCGLDGGRVGVIHCKRMTHGTGGTFATLSELYKKTRGFDERLRGWGIEDGDFIQRVKQFKPHALFDPKLIKHIDHSHERRTQYHPEKQILKSYKAQEEYIKTRTNVNPAGPGRGLWKMFKGTGQQLPGVHWIDPPPPPRRRINGPRLRRLDNAV